MDKAIEAAAAEAFKWIGLAANVHWTDPHVDEGRKNIWRSAMRKAIHAYLSALKEDPEVVERVAKAIGIATRAEFTPGNIGNWKVWMPEARAALSALLRAGEV